MYQAAGEGLAPPGPHGMQVVNEIGQERFLQDMVRMSGTKYGAEALYALGYFGDRRHVASAAAQLHSESQERRQLATFALGRLVGVNFGSAEQASAWWRDHCQEYPGQ